MTIFYDHFSYISQKNKKKNGKLLGSTSALSFRSVDEIISSWIRECN